MEVPQIGVPLNHPLVNHPFGGNPIYAKHHIITNMIPFISLSKYPIYRWLSTHHQWIFRSGYKKMANLLFNPHLYAFINGYNFYIHNSDTLNQFPRSRISLRKNDTIVNPQTNQRPTLYMYDVCWRLPHLRRFARREVTASFAEIFNAPGAVNEFGTSGICTGLAMGHMGCKWGV